MVFSLVVNVIVVVVVVIDFNQQKGKDLFWLNFGRSTLMVNKPTSN